MPIAASRLSLLAHLPAPPAFRLATCLVLACAFLLSGQRIRVIPIVLTGPDENPAWIWSVNELESWDGKPEAFAFAKLGAPAASGELKPPIPHIGVFQGVQARLDAACPGYADKVRVLGWHDAGINSHVFLLRRNGQWVILDAVSWADGVEF